MLAAVAASLGLGAAPALGKVAAGPLTEALAAQPIPGPGLGITSLDSLTVAHDGTGAVAYIADVAGIQHAFVSRLVNGAFQAPEEIDSSLGGGTTDVVLASDSGGELVAAMVTGGGLFVTSAPGTGRSFSAPQEIAGSASSPALSVNRFGDGYLAFTVPDGGGSDVQAAYYNSTTGWAMASPATMNVTAGDNAGVGTGVPSVAAAGDGVGIIAWGENGHVYARRIWNTAPSTETEQLDPGSVDGAEETSAGNAVVASGGDSSYADVAFQEQVSDAALKSGLQSRVLVSRLVAEDTEPAVPVDGLQAGIALNASQPQIQMGEFGDGFVTDASGAGDQVQVTTLGNNGAIGSTQLLGGVSADEPFAMPATSGLVANAVVWQQTDGQGDSQVYASYAADGTALSPPTAISSPASGPVQAASGLFAAGDGVGDMMYAWAQGTPGALSLESDEMLVPSTAAKPPSTRAYTTNAMPTFSWRAAREYWDPLTYTITLDGTVVAQSTSPTYTPTAPLTDGPHLWSVESENAAGQQVTSSNGTEFVDTTRPKLTVRLKGRLMVGTKLTLRNVYADDPNPAEPNSQPSGIGSVTVSWGKHIRATRSKKLLRVTHRYTRAGRYSLTVTVADRAGNLTTVKRSINVKPHKHRSR